MKDLNIGVIPVFHNRQPVGIVTDRDITIRDVATGKDPATTKVGDIMTSKLVTCKITDDIQQAVRLMEDNRVRRLLVQDEQGEIAGILSLGDIATHTEECLSGELLKEVSEPSRPEW